MAPARPKRKRAQVNYLESDPIDEDESIDAPSNEHDAAQDSEHTDEEIEDSDDDFSLKKKRKSKAKKKKKKKTAPKKKKEKPFPFLSLPPELRNMIYKITLVETTRDLSIISTKNNRCVARGWMERVPTRRRWFGSGSTWRSNLSRHSNNHTRLTPALLATSQEVNTEAGSMLYSQTIQFENAVAMQIFLLRIGSKNRGLLRDLVLRGWEVHKKRWDNAMFPAFSLLTDATSLTSLVLDRYPLANHETWCYGQSTLAYLANNLSKDIQLWVETIDTTQGEGAARSILEVAYSVFGSEKQQGDEPEKVKSAEKAFFAALKI